MKDETIREVMEMMSCKILLSNRAPFIMYVPVSYTFFKKLKINK